MLPTLNESGDVILVDKLTPRLPEALGGVPIRRGDIIVADSPKDGSHKMVVKRVVGLPGDVITVAGGRFAPSTPYKGKTVRVSESVSIILVGLCSKTSATARV